MAQETLNRIKETELLARQAVKEAKDQAEAVMADARDKAAGYRDDLLAKCRADAALRLENARSGMDKSLEAAQERAQAVIAQMDRSLEKKKDKAVQMVIDYICS